jgi:hypothetical protein
MICVTDPYLPGFGSRARVFKTKKFYLDLHEKRQDPIIFFIPDPHQRSILTQKIVSKLSEILFGLFIPEPDPYFLPILDPASGGQKGTGSRFRIRNTGQNIKCLHIFLFRGYFGLPESRSGKRIQGLDRIRIQTLFKGQFVSVYLRGGWLMQAHYRIRLSCTQGNLLYCHTCTVTFHTW